MRLRTVAASAALAATTLGGLSSTAWAAAPASSTAGTASTASPAGWTYIADYWSKYACVDAGQQYEREGWSAYKCTYYPLSEPPYELWIQ